MKRLRNVQPVTLESTKRAKSAAGPRYRKRRSVSRIPTTVYMGKQAFPKQLRNTVSYSELVQYNISAGAVGATYTWNANSLYDPNRTGVGHQPLYFDQLMVIYDHYTVLRSRIRCTVAYPTTAGVNSIVATLYNDDDGSAATDALLAAERPGAFSRMWKPAVDGNPTLFASFDAKAVFGGDPASDPELHGNSSSSPTEISTFHLQTYDNTLTGATGVQLYVYMEFDVLWDELATTSSS